MAGIYHPSRGGVRGGKDQFNWDDVRTDKDRENYLGHSLMVPVGKWQEGKDLMWYTRGKNDKEKEERELKKKREIQAVKDLERRAMDAALGKKSFTTGTTSLTAKELQEVLSRGKTEHSSEDLVSGIGHKKSMGSSKQGKYGTTFMGFEGSRSTQVAQEQEDLDESPKKRNKKKKKKASKEVKKRKSNESSSDSDYQQFPVKKHKPSDLDENRGKQRHLDKGKKRRLRSTSSDIDQQNRTRRTQKNHQKTSAIDSDRQHNKSRESYNDERRNGKYNNEKYYRRKYYEDGEKCRRQKCDADRDYRFQKHDDDKRYRSQEYDNDRNDKDYRRKNEIDKTRREKDGRQSSRYTRRAEDRTR